MRNIQLTLPGKSIGCWEVLELDELQYNPIFLEMPVHEMRWGGRDHPAKKASP